MANQKKQSSKNPDPVAGLGDIAKLVLDKLDEHGVTMEQAIAAIAEAGKEAPAKKPAAKKHQLKKHMPKVKQ